LVGNGGAFLSAVALGACGAVLALANVAPRECVRVYELIDSGEAAAAQELAFRLVPVNTAVTVTYGVPGLKAALTQLGYRGGVPRLPLQILGAQEQRDLEAILRKAQLIQ